METFSLSAEIAGMFSDEGVPEGSPPATGGTVVDGVAAKEVEDDEEVGVGAAAAPNAPVFWTRGD